MKLENSPNLGSAVRIGLCALAVSAVVDAAAQQRREHDAHEHGHGELNIVAEGGELLLELRVPAVNVVGFEHEPSTAAQREAVEGAVARFRRGETLFVPSAAAECRLEEVEVELGGIGSEPEHVEDGKEHPRSAEEGKVERHAEHADEGKESHAELHAEYRFVCDAPDELSVVEVKVLEVLRDMDELAANVITESAQTRVHLDRDDSRVKLAQR